MGITKWTPEKVKKQVLAEVAANSQMAGEIVRDDARKRLAGIRDPDWGAAYRGFVAGLLQYEIEVGGNEVRTTVGVSGGYTRYHGFYIEVGSSTRGPNPWLRPALVSNYRKIVAAIGGGG